MIEAPLDNQGIEAIAEILSARTDRRIPVSIDSLTDLSEELTGRAARIFSVKFNDSRVNSLAEVCDKEIKIYLSSNISDDWRRYVCVKELISILLDYLMSSRLIVADDNIIRNLIDSIVSPNFDPERLDRDRIIGGVARAFLMSAAHVHAIWPAINNPLGLAELFQVPIPVAIQRLEELKISSDQDG